MKICPNCGISLADEVGFCTNCGTAVNAEPAPQPEAPVQPTYVPPVYVPPTVPVAYVPAVEEKKESISVGGWMGRDLLPCIPVVGGIIYFIMLWVWAGNNKYEDSFRNWAKSRLIWMAIGAGIGLVVVILMVFMGVSFAELFEEAVYF